MRGAVANDDPQGVGVTAAEVAVASVELEGVVKEFTAGFTAVNGIDLSIAQGEFFTMLGPSGCGKTTTLRMIAGFERPTQGKVKIEGTDVAGLPPYKRPTNTVFQSYALFPHLTVAENIAFGLKRKKVDGKETKRRVAHELERVGLAAEAARKPAMLSGGQQQRVALARALVNLPKVLLLDEPLGALDLKLRKGLQVQLKEIQRDVGITFVYVTHDQEEALTMSDRIAVMNAGVIEQCAGPEEVYERPSTTFVAGFIGVSNLMPARVVGSGQVNLDDGPTLAADTTGLASGEACFAVVRPEKLRVELNGHVVGGPGSESNGQSGAISSTPANDLPGIEGTVESSLFLGTATQLAVKIASGAKLTVLVPNASEADRQRLPGGGAKVRLAWHPDHMHLISDSSRPKAREAEPA